MFQAFFVCIEEKIESEMPQFCFFFLPRLRIIVYCTGILMCVWVRGDIKVKKKGSYIEEKVTF